jgi:hypothetical protein
MARAELNLDALGPNIAHTPHALSRFILKRLKDSLPSKKSTGGEEKPES